MKVNKGDYIVAKLEGSKKFLAGKALAVEGSSVRVVGIENPHIKKRTAEFPLASILLNLGKDPQPGKVYGLDFSQLYRGKTEVPKLGLRLNWFYVPEKEQRKSLESAFRIVYKKLKPLGLGFLLDNDNTVWEIQGQRSGKYCGMYLQPKEPMAPGRLQICPNKANPPDYPYIIVHELGHRLHMKYATDSSLNARWLHQFSNSIRLVDVDRATSKRMLSLIIESDVRPSILHKEMGEDDALAFKWLVRYLASSRSITSRDLDDLHRAEAFDDIKAIWPVRAIPKKELQPVLTEYACKNVRELVAESFAYYVLGKKMPKALVKLTERTISIGKQVYKNPD